MTYQSNLTQLIEGLYKHLIIHIINKWTNASSGMLKQLMGWTILITREYSFYRSALTFFLF